MSTRATADLRPGDTVRAAGPTVRTLRENIHPRPESRWHVLSWEDGSSFWSACDDSWELTETQADAWDQGYAAALHDASESIRQENPYRA